MPDVNENELDPEEAIIAAAVQRPDAAPVANPNIDGDVRLETLDQIRQVEQEQRRAAVDLIARLDAARLNMRRAAVDPIARLDAARLNMPPIYNTTRATQRRDELRGPERAERDRQIAANAAAGMQELHNRAVEQVAAGITHVAQVPLNPPVQDPVAEAHRQAAEIRRVHENDGYPVIDPVYYEQPQETRGQYRMRVAFEVSMAVLNSIRERDGLTAGQTLELTNMARSIGEAVASAMLRFKTTNENRDRLARNMNGQTMEAERPVADQPFRG